MYPVGEGDTTSKYRHRHVFAQGLFKRYDIRGSFGDDLNENDAYSLGLAFANLCQGGTIIVGRDTRLSSPALYNSLLKGLLHGGSEVIAANIVSSPFLVYAAKSLGTTGAIMVTGSHNAANQNGFKLIHKGKPFFADNLQLLESMLLKGVPLSYEIGKIKELQTSVIEQYTKLLQSLFHVIDKKLSVVWDASNGAICPILKRVLPLLPGQHTLINGDCDGNFPNHHPDPTQPDNLRQLKLFMQKNKVDIGFCFDGDGDRLGVVAANGKILRADHIALLICQQLLQTKIEPKATILVDVKMSPWLIQTFCDLGADVIISRTGHSEIKQKMLETKALFACEGSQHFYFGTYGNIDDALIAAAHILHSISDQPLAATLKDTPTVFSTGELRFEIPINEIQCILSSDISQLVQGKVSTVDGLRVEAENGWWLFRPSNTENCVIFIAESHSEQALSCLMEEIKVFFSTINCEIMNNALTNLTKQPKIKLIE
jgi:phosphomannomutase